MSSTWELKEKSNGILKAEVSGEEWKKAQKKAINKLAEKANIPGFRKGHAPVSLIKQQVGMQSILYEAVDLVINKALSDAVEENDLWLVARPSADIESIDEEKVVFVYNCIVKPEVTLGQYKGLEIKEDVVEVSESDVDGEIEKLQDRFADLVVKEDGKVENGDTAVIDFEGFRDGVPFEGGKGDNYPLVIGSGSFIPGFEEQLLGMASEETKDINVTFPEDYQASDLAGVAVVFKVTVHEIKAKVLPEVNDDLVKQAKIEGVETIEDYRKDAKEKLEKSKSEEAKQKFENELLTAICDNATVEIPEVMVEQEIDSMYKEFTQRITSQGLTMEQFYQFTNQDEEQIRAEMAKDAQKKVKVGLVLDAIVKAENIEVNDEEIEAEYSKVADMYQMQVEVIKQYINKDSLSYDLRQQKALTLVKENVAE